MSPVPSPATQPPYVDAEQVEAPLQALREFTDRLRSAESVATALYWDERVAMPAAAAGSRADQREHVTRWVHGLRTGGEARAVLAAAREWSADHPEVAAMTRELGAAWQLPADLVGRTARATADARHAWDSARAHDEAGAPRAFAEWLPHLRTVLDLAREEAEVIGYEREPYEQSLAKWEPGISVEEVADLLESLAERVGPGVRAASDAGEADRSILDRPLLAHRRVAFERDLLAGLGFDWNAGRIDPSPRAFCLSVAPGDVRLTSRFHNVPGTRNVHSSLHEAGHGIYAQALHRLGLPSTIAAPAGLGLDESQSRGFERLVGCSSEFWSFHYPHLVAASGGALTAGEQAAFVEAIDAPHVDHLRIDSIGPAYDLHVLLRMRLERAMVNGELDPADLPEAWREGARELLGIEVTSDARGCMQDVHWAIGQWGYFPTYSLGNIYAKQLAEAYAVDLPGLGDELATAGTTTQLVAWLDEHVHAWGCSRSSREIVEAASAAALSIEPLARRYGVA